MFREDSHISVTFNFTEACFKERCYLLYHTVRGSVLEQVSNKSLIQEGKVSILAIGDKAYNLSNMHLAVLSGKQQINRVLHRGSAILILKQLKQQSPRKRLNKTL